MTKSDAERAAQHAHLRSRVRVKGDPLPLPLTLASIFDLPGDPVGFAQYGRTDNPTWEGLEHALEHLEDSPCVAFPSGMGAISASLLALLRSGDRILLPSDGYYTTRLLADRFLKRLGIEADLRPVASFSEGGFDGYALVFIETPSNPGLDVLDIGAVTRAAKAAGALVVADNTTMTPYGQRPLDLGCDIVVASDTKAPNGHSDTLFGHVATRNADLYDTIKEWRKLSGAIPGPFEAWLVHRGLETLELRFDRMCSSAGIIAERLADHPGVRTVRYPGLADDPSHELARKQMTRFGFLIALTLDDAQRAERFIADCPLIAPATSFGGVHTAAERRARWGDQVAPGFIRLTIGCEPTEELWKAIDGALKVA